MTTSFSGTSGVTFPDNSTQNTAASSFGFKNRIINGAMGIWQRGTTTGSVSGTTAPYMVDRFYGYAGTGNITISQSSNVPSGYTYSCSMVGTGVSITQRIESKNCTDLGGATVTVSFWALNSSGSDNLSVSLYTATGGVDNWSSQTSTTNVVSASPSGSWTYYTSTFTSIPSTATNGVGIGIGRGSSGSSTTLITGVQLEKGSTATSFDYRPYGTELALCQRYCVRFNDPTDVWAVFTSGSVQTATSFYSPITGFNMRAAPTATYSTLQLSQGGTGKTISAIGSSIGVCGTINLNVVSSAMTAGNSAILQQLNSASGYLQLTAEL